MSLKKTINIFPYQQKILQSTKPLIVAICGRSVGKSFIAGHWAFKKALQCDGMGIIVAPVYSQAEVPLKYLMNILEEYQVPYVFNKQPQFAKSMLPSHTNILSILLNGKLKQIKMASADVEDNLRSGSYSWAVIDEACYCSESSWMVLNPTFRGQGTNFNYQVLMISSPAGKNWLYEKFIENDSSNIEVLRAKSSENIYQVNDEKLALWQETMSSRMFDQEINAIFLDANLNGIFYSYSKDIHLTNDTPHIERVMVSLDQNVDDGSGIIATLKNDIFTVYDEFRIDQGANFSNYATEIIKRVPNNSIIEIYGDASGNKRDVSALISFYASLFKELKSRSNISVKDKTNRSNPSQFEAFEEVNRRLERKKLLIKSNLKHLIKDLEMSVYKKGTFEADKKTWDGHSTDALKYLLWEHRPGSRLVATNKLISF